MLVASRSVWPRRKDDMVAVRCNFQRILQCVKNRWMLLLICERAGIQGLQGKSWRGATSPSVTWYEKYFINNSPNGSCGWLLWISTLIISYSSAWDRVHPDGPRPFVRVGFRLQNYPLLKGSGLDPQRSRFLALRWPCTMAIVHP